ncbi:hypothetical protein ACSBR1_037765 [Camellia fascicularis]
MLSEPRVDQPYGYALTRQASGKSFGNGIWQTRCPRRTNANAMQKNTQVEHHLFPRLPRCQLRKISPFVMDLCKKHNLLYNIAPFWKANVLTIRTLRNAALQARDLASPIPKNLVWEAVNTHG